MLRDTRSVLLGANISRPLLDLPSFLFDQHQAKAEGLSRRKKKTKKLQTRHCIHYQSVEWIYKKSSSSPGNAGGADVSGYVEHVVRQVPGAAFPRVGVHATRGRVRVQPLAPPRTLPVLRLQTDRRVIQVGWAVRSGAGEQAPNERGLNEGKPTTSWSQWMCLRLCPNVGQNDETAFLQVLSDPTAGDLSAAHCHSPGRQGDVTGENHGGRQAHLLQVSSILVACLVFITSPISFVAKVSAFHFQHFSCRHHFRHFEFVLAVARRCTAV